MRPEDATPLAAAAARKHHAALQRASGALRDLDAAGHVINFQAVARAAGVSRQWLHQQPELRREIERLRDSRPQRASGVPTAARERGLAAPAQPVAARRERAPARRERAA